MRGYYLSKRVFSLLILLVFLLSINLPVFAASTGTTGATGNVDKNSSMIIPFDFKGKLPNRNDVVINNIAAEPSVAAGNPAVMSYPAPGLPQPVQVTMTATEAVTSGSINMTVADKYFIYNESGISNYPFYAEFGDLPEDDYDVILYSPKTYQEVSTYLYTGSEVPEVSFYDVSSLFASGSTTQDVSVYIYNYDHTKILYGPETVTLNYVPDNVATTSEYDRYIRDDAMEAYVTLELPYSVDNPVDGMSISLKNGSNNTVAVYAPDFDNYASYSTRTEYTDDRYKNVFTDNSLRRRMIELRTNLQRTTDLVPGIYSMEYSGPAGTFTIPDAVESVSGVLIDGMYASTSDGYAPPSVGGKEAYITLYQTGASKDDFKISILDGNNNVIGNSTKSTYNGGSNKVIFYVPLLTGKVFAENQNYKIKLTYLKSGNLCYTGDSANPGLYLSSDFDIYSVSYDKVSRLANFSMKAVNVPAEPIDINLGLFNDSVDGTTPISTTTIKTADTMTAQFKDTKGNVIVLNGNTSYSIRIRYNSGDYEYWDYVSSFYVNFNGNRHPAYVFNSKPYFNMTDNTYSFDISLEKSTYSLVSLTEYNVKLLDASDNVVGNQKAGTTLTKLDSEITYYNDDGVRTTSAAIRLKGDIALSDTSIPEDTYYLKVDMKTGTLASSIRQPISRIQASKIFATENYFDVSFGTTIKFNTRVYMLKTGSAYDSSKFTYEFLDLFGNIKASGPLTFKTIYDKYLYEDYYTFSADVPALPANNYYYRLKYDGKSIYDLSYPTQLVNRGYYGSLTIPETPHVSSIYTGTNNGIFGVSTSGYMKDSDKMSVIIYNNENTAFDPVKTVDLVKDTGVNYDLYIFPAGCFAGFDTSKLYNLAFLINGLPVSYDMNWKVETKYGTSSLPAKGNLDSPSEGQTISGTSAIKGWFLDGNGVSKVEVLVDGVLKGTAAYGELRNDIGTAFPDYKNSNCGFSYNLDTTKLTNGSHSIVIRETGSSGTQTNLAARTVTVSNVLPAKGALDTPKEGQTVSGTFAVKGWFLDGSGVSKVEVLVDGTVKGTATYGQARTDIGSLFPDYKNNNCGYSYNLDTTKLTNGSHSIVIRETGVNAKTTSLAARSVTVSNALPAKGALDTPKAGQTVSGICAVKGWFLDGSGVSKIEVLVDGTVKGTATYGQARTDIGTVFPDYKNNNCGYSYSLDTTKLTNGSHSIVIRETGVNGALTSLAARSVTVSNALPAKGALDTPKAGQTVSGICAVKGWFLDGSGVSKIEVLVDGSVKGTATYGQARTDIGTVFPDYKNSNCGYSYSLDTTKLSNGSHSIVIRETGVNGAQTSLAARSVTVSNALPAKGAIDTPKEGSTVSGTSIVRGWFLDGSGVSKVEVLVDGIVKGTATYGQARTDIAAVFPTYNNSNCGYSYSLDTTKLSNGSHSIVIRETGVNSAQTSLAARTVTVSNALPAKGALDTPKAGSTVSGTCVVRGWFLDGSGVSKVEVLVDGVVKGTATYGSARTDIATVFPAYNNSNCGYSYNLDTTKLSNGSHSIVIRETGVNSAQTSLAARSVTVAN